MILAAENRQGPGIFKLLESHCKPRSLVLRYVNVVQCVYGPPHVPALTELLIDGASQCRPSRVGP